MSTTGGIGRERGYTILIVLLVVSIGFAAIDFVLLNLKNGEDRQAIALTTQIQVLSQQTAKYALEASGGNPDSFAELENARDTIDSAVQRLVSGDTKTGMKPYADKNTTTTGRAVTKLADAWKSLDSDIGKILSNKQVVLDSSQRADNLSKQLPLLNSNMEQVVNILQQRKGTSADEMLGTSRQMLTADRIIRRVQEVLQGGESEQASADGLSRDAQNYAAVLQGLLQGNQGMGVAQLGDANARKILSEMQDTWNTLSDPISKLAAAASNIAEVKSAGNQASLDSSNVLLRANDVADQIGQLPLRRLFPNVGWGVVGAIGAVPSPCCWLSSSSATSAAASAKVPNSTSVTRRPSCACWTKWVRSPKVT
jgi:twitching motility protein PilJ